MKKMIKGLIIYILRPIPDRIYISILYYFKFHKLPNIKNPKTFNEKIQWLKLYDRKPLYTILVDKVLAKEYVAEIVGDEHVVPLIGVWKSQKDIDFNSLPNQFVLKWNHDCGSTIICKNKNMFNIKRALRNLSYGQWINGYYPGREWPYKNVPKRVFAEKYLVSGDDTEVINYRFYFFQEELKAIVIEKRDINIDYCYTTYNDYVIIRQSSIQLDVLKQIDEMIDIARKLSKGLTHVRIDLYNVNSIIYFGEFTFYDYSGFGKNNTILPEYNKMFDNWLILPNNRVPQQ